MHCYERAQGEVPPSGNDTVSNLEICWGTFRVSTCVGVLFHWMLAAKTGRNCVICTVLCVLYVYSYAQYFPPDSRHLSTILQIPLAGKNVRTQWLEVGEVLAFLLNFCLCPSSWNILLPTVRHGGDRLSKLGESIRELSDFQISNVGWSHVSHTTVYYRHHGRKIKKAEEKKSAPSYFSSSCSHTVCRGNLIFNQVRFVPVILSYLWCIFKLTFVNKGQLGVTIIEDQQGLIRSLVYCTIFQGGTELRLPDLPASS